MGISVCMIVRDEALWIEACLASIETLVEEIILVDTGSRDETKAIASRFKAKIFDFEWTGDFSEARNFSLKQANEDWILILDADERMAPKDLLEIQKLVQETSEVAFSLPTRNYTEMNLASGFKPNSSEYPDFEKNFPGYFESRKVRLFRNRLGVQFKGSVHELVEKSLTRRPKDLSFPIHHYGATEAEVERKKKRDFYQKQVQQKVKEQPTDWKAHFELGIECLTAGRIAEAVKALREAEKLNSQETMVLNNLGYAYMELGQHEEAERVLRASLQLDAHNHDALLNLGVNFMRQKAFSEALGLFDRLIEAHPHSFTGFRNAGNCYAQLRDLQKAANCFQHALQLFPDFHEARVDLALVCLAGGRADLAKPEIERVLREQPKNTRAQLALQELERLRECR
ncbi:MAG: tetratricopeptide repeat protein [Bradymonadales bacterium]|nr:MAG: tetratricopeptide repeat protein [Bradymonadales bacterium]